MSKFVNMGQSFEMAKVMFDLYAHLDVSPRTILGIALKKAVSDKRPIDEIIQWVKEFTADNKPASEQVIGKELLEKILNL
jgi:hypothetical protein